MGSDNVGKELEVEASQTSDGFALFIRKKVEKTTTAVYLVTELLPDQEPMKWLLRQNATGLLGELSPYIHRGIGTKRSTLLSSRVSEIRSLLDVARSAKLLSGMNVGLLQDAYQELLSLFGEMEQKTYLQPDLFDVDKMSFMKEAHKDKEKKEFYTTPPEMLSDMSLRTNMSDMSDKARKQESTKKKSASQKSGTPGAARERRKQIVKVVSGKKEATIGDIKEVVDDVSDKTLQRDLAHLVKKGTLKRSGSKRWTKYSIVLSDM